MSSHIEPKHFIFNNKFDRQALTDLYEDDYAYMEEIFSITLTQLKGDLILLKKAYAGDDLAELKKTAHKIKPSFGFVGLPHQQQLCKNFEELCSAVSNTREIGNQYHQLESMVEEFIGVIEDEYVRLKDFNKA